MELGRVGIWASGLLRGDPGLAVESVAELEQLGYDSVWIPGGLDASLLDRSEGVLAGSSHIVVTTAIISVWAISAADLAARHAELTAAHPDRFFLGLGISHAPLVALSGQHYERPMETTRAYLDQLDEATQPVPVRERFLAAQGPRMLELARDRTAGAHPFNVPPEHTRRAREVLGSGPLLAPGQKVVLSTDPDEARAIGRQALEIYLGLPNYSRNWLRLGFTPDDLEGGGSDRLVDALVAWGDHDAVAARVGEHFDAGADHVCLDVLGGAGGAPTRELWRELAGLNA